MICGRGGERAERWSLVVVLAAVIGGFVGGLELARGHTGEIGTGAWVAWVLFGVGLVLRLRWWSRPQCDVADLDLPASFGPSQPHPCRFGRDRSLLGDHPQLLCRSSHLGGRRGLLLYLVARQATDAVRITRQSPRYTTHWT